MCVCLNVCECVCVCVSVCVCMWIKRVPGLVLGKQSSLAMVMYNERPIVYFSLFTPPVVIIAKCSCKIPGQASGDKIMLAPA